MAKTITLEMAQERVYTKGENWEIIGSEDFERYFENSLGGRYIIGKWAGWSSKIIVRCKKCGEIHTFNSGYIMMKQWKGWCYCCHRCDDDPQKEIDFLQSQINKSLACIEEKKTFPYASTLGLYDLSEEDKIAKLEKRISLIKQNWGL